MSRCLPVEVTRITSHTEFDCARTQSCFFTVTYWERQKMVFDSSHRFWLCGISQKPLHEIELGKIQTNFQWSCGWKHHRGDWSIWTYRLYQAVCELKESQLLCWPGSSLNILMSLGPEMQEGMSNIRAIISMVPCPANRFSPALHPHL